MKSVIVSPKYQVVIPKEIRDNIGIKPGTRLQILNYGNRIELLPIVDIKKLKGSLKGINTSITRDKDRL